MARQAAAPQRSRRGGTGRGHAVARAVGRRLSPAAGVLPAVVHHARCIGHAQGTGRTIPPRRTGRCRVVASGCGSRIPFVGTRPFQGLLVILLTFNSFDLKNSNNTFYDVRGPRRSHRAVVRRPRSGRGARRERAIRAHAERSGSLRARDLHHRRPRRLRDVQLSRLASGTVPRPHHARRCSSGPPRCCPGSAIASGTTRSAPAATRRRSPDRYIRKLHANIARAQQVADDASAAWRHERR